MSNAPVRSLRARAVARNSALKGTDSALALHGFKANGANTAVKLPFQVFDVVERDKTHARHEGNEGLAILGLSGGGKRAKSAPMKRTVESEQAPLGLVPVVVLGARIGAGELEGAFPSLSAAVAEKGPLQAGNPD
jgi:hypothetical protein